MPYHEYGLQMYFSLRQGHRTGFRAVRFTKQNEQRVDKIGPPRIQNHAFAIVLFLFLANHAFYNRAIFMTQHHESAKVDVYFNFADKALIVHNRAISIFRTPRIQKRGIFMNHHHEFESINITMK